MSIDHPRGSIHRGTVLPASANGVEFRAYFVGSRRYSWKFPVHRAIHRVLLGDLGSDWESAQKWPLIPLWNSNQSTRSSEGVPVVTILQWYHYFRGIEHIKRSLTRNLIGSLSLGKLDRSEQFGWGKFDFDSCTSFNNDAEILNPSPNPQNTKTRLFEMPLIALRCWYEALSFIRFDLTWWMNLKGVRTYVSLAAMSASKYNTHLSFHQRNISHYDNIYNVKYRVVLMSP